MPAVKLASMPGGESVTWNLQLRVLGVGSIVLQPLITLPGRSSAAGMLEVQTDAATAC